MSTLGPRCVILINGPIGSGKSTLGRALADNLNALFIDSDDLGDPDKRWFEKIRTTSELLVQVGLEALRERGTVVVAKPLRRRDWHYFKARFETAGVTAFCVTLSATLAAIVDPARGRTFSDAERARIAVMIEEGYASRPFSDCVLATDRADFETTLACLTVRCRALLQAARNGQQRPPD